jgi:hypothetical protein
MAYQSDNGDCGVIASLQTGYSGISDPSCDFVPAQMGFQNAPSALPNADTFHVAAYFDDQTAPLHSLLRFALNQYVQSVAPGNSLDQILGNDPDGAEPNDVLVTVPSQINNIVLPSGVAATPNLEHTAALPSTYLAEAQLLAGIGFSDENVMNSSLVNAAILCVLVSSGSDTSCVSSPVPSVELGQESLRAEIPQAGNSAPVHQFLAEGRVDVLAPTQPLRLADENEISLRIHAPGLNKLESEQLVYPGIDDSLTPQPLNEAYAQLPILHHPDGSAYIKVTPIRLGHLRLRFWTHFPDGGYTKTEIEVTVEPPERAPTKLIVAQLGMPSQTHMIEMNVYMKPVTNRSAITVSAFYEGVKQLIPIYASYASFEIRTANDASIIDLDRTTGYIKPLQVGEALVKTSFAGWTNLTCVLVESERNPDEGPTPTCESLLLPGEKLATPTQQ